MLEKDWPCCQHSQVCRLAVLPAPALQWATSFSAALARLFVLCTALHRHQYRHTCLCLMNVHFDIRAPGLRAGRAEAFAPGVGHPAVIAAGIARRRLGQRQLSGRLLRQRLPVAPPAEGQGRCALRRDQQADSVSLHDHCSTAEGGAGRKVAAQLTPTCRAARTAPMQPCIRGKRQRVCSRSRLHPRLLPPSRCRISQSSANQG